MITHDVLVEAKLVGDEVVLALVDASSAQPMGYLALPVTSVADLLFGKQRGTGTLALSSPPFVQVDPQGLEE